MNTPEQILSAFNFRHACKEFNPHKKISKPDFNVILEAARLSPSSFGFEPWKFLILQNPDLREKIRPVCWGAQKQLPTASHFVIILARTGADMSYDSDYIKSTMAEVQKSPPEIIETRINRLKKFQQTDFNLNNETSLFDWASKQAYIALSNMMTAAALLKIDSCPIEGFNREKLEQILVDEKILDKQHFGVTCLVAFGYRAEPPKKPRTRRSLDKITDWFN
ncbi:NAD(P)H-dependent oxidoreductase [Patescibacteria group bacterium]|nr:NAD(P)H-dependent oxidoreductase [Patescibacteria group bacterium]